LRTSSAAIGVRANRGSRPNSFPGIVTIGAVVEAMLQLAGGDANGRIAVIDPAGRGGAPPATARSAHGRQAPPE